jgi:hypothetical protein
MAHDEHKNEDLQLGRERGKGQSPMSYFPFLASPAPFSPRGYPPILYPVQWKRKSRQSRREHVSMGNQVVEQVTSPDEEGYPFQSYQK